MTTAHVDADAMPESSLQNLLDATSLRWIFVGGKGGVGKTTTSCSLAAALSRVRSSVLLVSTDPAHNLSDAFGQKFNKNATAVNGFNNLFAMEIDPQIEFESSDILEGASSGLIAELASSIPGIDEAMSFAELMRQVQSMQYDVIVFDTAPTGHTLRLLTFPTILEKALDRLNALRSRFSGVISQLGSVLQSTVGGGATSGNAEEKIMTRIESLRETVGMITRQFRDPDLTTFVCVCIPEFLSLFETERLVQELARHEIDVHNVVVNQVCVMERGSNCGKCRARKRMQSKYLDQIQSLYEDFHVVTLPLLDAEVRGTAALQQFSEFLIHPERALALAEEPRTDTS
jgi:arsenite-transporting ATPase